LAGESFWEMGVFGGTKVAFHQKKISGKFASMG
jgi:hypothetical protein